MNSEDLCIGEYKQSERKNKGAAFLPFLITVTAVALTGILFLYYSAWYEPKTNHIITSLPAHAIIIKKYPDFYIQKRDRDGNIYFEGETDHTIIQVYIGKIKGSNKEKPELSRKREGVRHTRGGAGQRSGMPARQTRVATLCT